MVIKNYFIAERGYWRPWTEAILRTNPEFLSRYAAYAGHPARTGPLSKRMIELIYLALDSSATHLYSNGVRTHLCLAFEAGATVPDVLDVLRIVTEQGLDAVYDGAQILAEEAGIDLSGNLPSELRARIERALPDDIAGIKALARMDPEYLDQVLAFVDSNDSLDGLGPAEQSLIEIALSACFTGFNPGALRRKIRFALEAGVNHGEILQAIQLGGHLSVHGTALGGMLLKEFLDSSATQASGRK
ncbi:carboxymuconolactone decarboxylase family protein (plasmid) [Sulfitobacter sp. W074]|nr:carboxymuconolactone decarboxylase family protein [Sulfitobacter sp. W074]